jgi:penicillin-binding protein 1A
MEKCYQDSDLQVSKEDFEKPANFNIKIDCYGGGGGGGESTDSTATKPADSLEIEQQNMNEF